MKLQFFKFEFVFDKEDAKIVVPLFVLLIALIFTQFNKEILLALAATYYLLYFFLETALNEVKECWFKYIKLRCPKCRSRRIFLQGYQGYKSDEHYPYYLCNDCHTTSIKIESGLMNI